MLLKKKKIQRAFIIYWVLLAYIIAALIWWFIALSRQNERMTEFQLQDLRSDDFFYKEKYERIVHDRKIKNAQYAGEGGTFLLLIMAGAVFVFRAVRRELRAGVQQQHFMMAITHELKTPIAVSKLNLETMRKRKLDEVQQQRLLENTLEETNRLDNLCNNLLLSSQMEAGGYRLVNDEQDLSALVTECAENFINRYPQRTFIKIIEADVFSNGDPFLLQMVVNNLLGNAVKYSSKEKPVGITLRKENGRALLSIIDEGAGIPDKEHGKVFQKFYRTGNEATKRARGTGLGLYIVKRITMLHDGNITIQNNSPSGSIFVFSLKAEA